MFLPSRAAGALAPALSPEVVPTLLPPHLHPTRKQGLSLPGHDKNTFIYCLRGEMRAPDGAWPSGLRPPIPVGTGPEPPSSGQAQGLGSG